jgi:hypothetical protein
MKLWGNDYNVREAAGAFGDLGTLIPFLVGYLTITKLDPVGVLVAFGVFKIVAGLYFRTPMPIQPMKAIGTVAISQAGTITPGAIWASGLFTGILWLTMGLTGAVSWVARITSRPVVQGLVLGLGLAFMLEGVKFMKGDYLTATVAGGVTFVLLLFGATVAVARQPALFDELGQMAFRFRLPKFALAGLGWEDILTGTLVLGLPQAALTLGNAIITTVEENNTLFPDRRITVRGVAIDHGLMNLVGTSIGGIPMCHGAGGMAGHVRFGARTGGSLVILGLLVLFVGLFLADSAGTLFRLFPTSVLGAIVFFGGLELAAGLHGSGLDKNDRYVLLVTAGVSMWNMGAGYLAGLLLWHCFQRGWLKA